MQRTSLCIREALRGGRSGRGEEGVAERKTYGLTAALIPHSPVLLGVEGKEENSEMEEQG